MNKLNALVLVAALLLLAVVPVTLAQDATPEASTRPPWACPEGFEGQTLAVYNWSLYIADDTVANFEAACGVTVTYDTYVSNEDLLSRLREGNPGYDIIVPTGYMIEIMIGEGLLEPIDFANVPNFANVSEDLKNPPYDPDGMYSVPYQWGTVGIAYRTDVVTEPPQTWDDLFSYAGNVAWLEDSRAMLGVGLLKLGYDPNSNDPAEIAEARDYLVANGENVVTIVQGNSQDLLSNQTVDMAVDYPGNTFQLRFACECEDYAYVIPTEGTNIWVDNLAIPVGAPNQALAEAWIDYILHPQVSADISNYTVYGTPNQVALDEALISADILDNPGIYPPPEVRANLFYTESVTGEAERAYLDAWDEIKILLGQ